MTLRILSAIADPDAARAATTLLGQLPGAEPGTPSADSTDLLTALNALAAGGIDELPEVVLVHERIGPLPALELVREIALRFPAVGVVLLSADQGSAPYSAAMDAGARGLIGLPLAYDELAPRVRTAATWASGVRRHLGAAGEAPEGPAGTLVTVSGAKGGVGATVAAVQLALAARASGASVALVDMDLQTGDVASYLDVQFRRSIADLAEIGDLSPRVLSDAMFQHPSGVSLLLSPADGEQGEALTDRAARQITATLRSRFDVVVVDCGSQLTAAGAVAIETADTALLLTTPDVVAVRAAKRTVRLWDRLRVRKPKDVRTVVNRLTRQTEIQPALVERVTGTKVARSTIPAAFRELQPVVDSGRMDELDSRGTVRQALWSLAAEVGVVTAPATPGERPGRAAHRLGRRSERRAPAAGRDDPTAAGGS